MSNLPISFGKTDIIRNPSLHLSYTFDKILSVESVVSQLPLNQNYIIKALQINLEGRTSNPNISISKDSNTTLFTLNTCYLTDIYPHSDEATTDKAFVIEGYSIEHVNKERILIFLPMTNRTNTENIFLPVERAIINKSRLEYGLDLNEFIPSKTIDTDYFTYYKHSDNDGIIYHIVYFDSSELGYTAALTSIPQNTEEYSSPAQALNHKSTTVPKQHSNMTNQFEDNIYIDCVPVDLLEQEAKKYLKVDKKYVNQFKDLMMYISYFILLTLIVYGIYYIYIYTTNLKSSPFPK